MRVLVACEESQVVCKAFRDKGHEAFSCDLQDCSGGHPEWHIKCDVLSVLNPSPFFDCFGDCLYGIRFRTADGCYHCFEGKWDLIIAHPPCTYMSKAGARHMYPKAGVIDGGRYFKALAARDFFMKILAANCDRICIENPTPLKVVDLPACTQVIQPYQFGHPYSKRTCLWTKGLPLLKPTDIVDEYEPYLPSNTSLFSKGRAGSKGVVSRSCVDRSKTFLGVAKAMAEQWG